MHIFLALYVPFGAVLSGFSLAVFGPRGGAIVFSILFGSVLLLLDTEVLLAILFLLAVVIVGSGTYFASVSLYWLPFIFGLLCYFIVISRRFAVGRMANRQGSTVPASVAGPALLFLTCVVASMAAGSGGLIHNTVALRDYLFLGSALFLTIYLSERRDFLKRFWLMMMGCALLQLPVVLYQYFFVAMTRSDAAKWDAVVGTFIGSQEGGGESGSLVVFLSLTFILALELARAGAVKFLWPIVLGTLLLTVVALSEVKLFFVVFAFFAVWQVAVSRRIGIGQKLLVGLFAVLGILLMAAVYDNFRQGDSRIYRSPQERIERSLAYSLDPKYVDVNGDVGRLASVVLWVEKSSMLSDPVGFWIGNGPGSTKLTRDGLGTVSKRLYPLRVDRNALAVLLWDFGILGTLAFLAFIGGILKLSLANTKLDVVDPWVRGYIEASPQVIWILLLLIPYSKALIATSPSTQLLFLIFAGLAIGFRSRLLGSASARHKAEVL